MIIIIKVIDNFISRQNKSCLSIIHVNSCCRIFFSFSLSLFLVYSSYSLSYIYLSSSSYLYNICCVFSILFHSYAAFSPSFYVFVFYCLASFFRKDRQECVCRSPSCLLARLLSLVPLSLPPFFSLPNLATLWRLAVLPFRQPHFDMNLAGVRVCKDVKCL